MASIVAKVERDRFMEQQSEKFPAYWFDRHKWYGTKLHREAIVEHGPSSLHRMSFCWNVLWIN
jgi:ribonuclease HII